MLLAEPPEAPRPVAVIPIGEAQEAQALAVAQRLRLDGIPAEIAYKGNLKRRMERANKQHAIAAILIGEEEVADGLLVVKDLDGGSQQRVSNEELPRALAEIGVLEAISLLMADEIRGEPDEEA
jgi:histidyl-tRNA synthetase